MGCGSSSAAGAAGGERASARPVSAPRTANLGAAAGIPAGNSASSRASGPGASNNLSGRKIKISGRYVLDGGPHTATQLAMKRQTFWESRTSGNATVWMNLRLAAEALLEGNVELAETVLDASELRLTHPDLTFCYDASGASYEVPPWVFRNPANMVSEDDMRKLTHSSKKSHTGPVQMLPLTMRLSAGETTLEQDVKLELASDLTGAGVKARLHEWLLAGKADQTPDPSTPKPNVWSARGGLPPARMRLIFRGRIIDDDVFLQEANVKGGDILQVFVRPE